eukprot:scaffold633_cov288-Ochromonas_danica.AAC.8
MLRVEEATGKLRETRLLEELISLEHSLNSDQDKLKTFIPGRYVSKRMLGSALHWDSNVLSQTYQRFPKQFFLRILKAEILLQQEAKKVQRLKEQEALQKTLQAAQEAHGGGAGGGSLSLYMNAENSTALVSSLSQVKEQRLETSKKKYIAKKRALQQVFINHAQDLVHKQLVLWDNSINKWRNVKVLSCHVTWLEGGTQVEITHQIQEYNDILEPIGNKRQVNLYSFKFFEAPSHNMDPILVERYKINLFYDQELKELEAKHQQILADLDAKQKQYEQKVKKDYQRLKHISIKTFQKRIHTHALVFLQSAAGRAALHTQIPEVVLEMKKGLVEVDSSKQNGLIFTNDLYHNNRLLRQQAKGIARDRLIEQFKTAQRAMLDDELAHAYEMIEEEIAKKAQHHLHLKEKQDRLYAQTRNQLLKEKAEQYKEYRQKLMPKLTFPREVFSRAVPKVYRCEHRRTKCWGAIYEKGIKCLSCGIELSNLHEDESQVLGYGTGYHPQLFQMLKQHVTNERTFRFKRAADLQWVEEERIRLEKEKRILYHNEENFFYDFQSIKAVYDFDLLHQKELKAKGLFRQGLQWKDHELESYLQDKLMEKRDSLVRQGLPLTLLEDYDPLGEMDHPPPTYRLIDEQHRAHYHELLFHMGRLQNYQRKIRSYRLIYFDLLDERKLYSQVVDSLHRSSFSYEVELQEAEEDLDRTSHFLALYSQMERLWNDASHILTQAKRNYRKAEMSIAGMENEIAEKEKELVYLHDEVCQLLILERRAKQRKNDILTLQQQREMEYQRSHQEYTLYQEKLTVLSYAMPGNLVMTKHYGACYVIAYRIVDDVLIVSLPFGRPRAKGYIYYKEIMEMERSINNREKALMEAEDRSCRLFYQLERSQRRKESYLMAAEESSLRQIYAYQDLLQQADGLAKAAIDKAVDESHFISQTRRYRQAQKKMVAKTLKFRVEERKKRRKDYIGPPSGRPKALGAYEVYLQRKAVTLELQQRFISQAAGAAEAKSRSQTEVEIKNWLQTYSFHNFLDRIVSEVIYEVCYEALTEGQQAKLSQEKKIGIYISSSSTPGNNFPMQYHVYRGLVDIWQRHKEEVQHKVETLKGEALRLIASLDPTASPNENDNKNNGSNKGLHRVASAAGGKDSATAGAGGNGGGKGGSATTATSTSQTASTKKLQRQEEAEMEAVIQARLEKAKRREEKRRQRRLCEEMKREEDHCRKFYSWELKENLRERRLMREEDLQMQRIRREEAKLRAEAREASRLMQSQPTTSAASKGGKTGVTGGAGGGTGGEGPGGTGRLTASQEAEIAARRDIALTYEQRRAELKEMTLERRRRAIDQAGMLLADEESQMLREIVRKDIQRAKYLAEYGLPEEMMNKGEGGESGKKSKSAPTFMSLLFSDEAGGDDNSVSSSSEKIKNKQNQLILQMDESMVLSELEAGASTRSLKIPSWMAVPKQFYTWPVVEQQKYLKIQFLLHFKNQKVALKAEREEKVLQRLENKSYKNWEKYMKMVEYQSFQSELNMIMKLEEFYQVQGQVQATEENLTKLTIFCRMKGEEELSLKSSIQRFQRTYQERLTEIDQAKAWLDICLNRARHRDKLKRRVAVACQYIDTESINGFHQRFETTRLRDRIYKTYFRSIVYSIVNKAETIASERKLMDIQYQLSRTRDILNDRIQKMKSLFRDIHAEEYLRMKRSFLNQFMFTYHRKEVLTNAFMGWVRFYMWNKGHQEAFKLKFEVLKREMDIKRQYKAQLEAPRLSKPPRSTTVVDKQQPQTELVPVPTVVQESQGSDKTLMQAVRERVLICQTCNECYLAAQNHSLACVYHPQPYQLACPKTCKENGLALACMAHRKRRWLCCYATAQGAAGCARRYHVPPPVDSHYEEVVKVMHAFDDDVILDLDSRLQAMQEQDYPSKLSAAREGRLREIESEIEDARATAARIKDIKFV